MSLALPIQATTGSTVANPATLAFVSNVQAGTYLYCLSDSSVLTETITGITDTLTNTWTVVAAVNVGTSRWECWRAPNPGAGANTVSITYSAHTVGKRIWIAEINGLGTTPTSASNTVDNTVAADPVPGATLTVTGDGIALVGIQLDTTNTYVAWKYSSTIPGFFFDMGGGSQSRAAMFPISASHASFAPLEDVSAGTESSESMTVAQYIDPQPSGGGVSRARVQRGM